MRAYSNDLRERVMAAWEEGKTQEWIAQTYRVSSGTIKRYIRRYRLTGSVEPTVQGRMQPLITAAHEPLLRVLVAQDTTADLTQYCEAFLAETGIVVSIKTMSRKLVRMGLRQKNDSGGTRTR